MMLQARGMCVSMRYFPLTSPSVEEGVHQLVGMAAASWIQMGEKLLAAVPRAAKDLQRSEKMFFVCQIVFLM